MSIFKSKPKPVSVKRPSDHLFTTELLPPEPGRGMDLAIQKSFPVDPFRVRAVSPDGVAMDSGISSTKANFAGFQQMVPENLAYWYGSQGFIGYQLCAMFSQHWLVDKACTMPARDAIRTGYEISVPEGIEVEEGKIAALKAMDKKMRINDELVQFIRMGRIFGIRIAMFLIDSPDPDYYLKPFNIDGVRPGSYKGITQIDPYWVTPELDFQAASNPEDPNFYVPTWWRVNGKRIHRSHLVIMTTSEVPDILKPSYLYGGVSIPQKIYERVYAAERTANEGPLLALTKRTTTMKTDITQATANFQKFQNTLLQFTNLRDNMGVKVVGLDDQMEQFDTSLTDLDAVIMTQYQIVAAASNVPATKLLGTTPKGFNATGEYEEASYHEELESIQTHDLTPFLQRHHMLCIKSEISPGNPFPTEVVWNALDTPTAKEVAEVNLIKAQAGNALVNSGAIDGFDERERLVLDPDSGYANLPSIDRELDIDEGNEEDDE